MFSDLLRELDSLRRRTARFRRVALHVHSPDSHDWGDRPHACKTRNAKSRFYAGDGIDQFADELKPHIDLVGITDHMRCDYANKLCSTLGCSEDFGILPGMEVNLRLEAPLAFARIHVLAIFPENSTNEAFARLFHGQGHIPHDGARTGQEEVTGVTLKEWVTRVHNEQGVCIAAHVENTAGLRKLFRQTARNVIRLFDPTNVDKAEHDADIPDEFRQYLVASGIDAIEVRFAKDVRHYRWVSDSDGKTYSIATLLSLDAHCVEDFARATDATHIKMTSLGIRGLQEALAFPDTRIRFPHNVPKGPLPRLLGIQITGDSTSLFSNLSIAVAENLNCIIGVRGSGKSTIVEALRYVFGYNRTLDEIPTLAKSVRELQKANLTGSLIRVAYRTETGEDRILVATFDPKSDYTTKVHSISGDFFDIPDVERSGNFPLRLFGWSEIENLGRDPAKQRDLLDRLIKELHPLLFERAEIRNAIVKNRGAVRKCIAELQAAFNTSNREIERYTEFKSDFEKQNTPEVRELFKALDFENGKLKVTKSLLQKVESLIQRVRQNVPINIQAEIVSLLTTPEMLGWWNESISPVLEIAQKTKDVEASLGQAEAVLSALHTTVSDEVAKLQTQVEAVERQLQSRFLADDSMQRIADLRTNAGKRLEHVSSLRESYLLRFRELESALDERFRIAESLIAIQDQIAELRKRHNANNEETLNRFLNDWFKVTIEFKKGGDREAFAQQLQKIFKGRGSSLSPKRVRVVVEQFTNPIVFSQMCRSSQFVDLIDKEADLDGKLVTLQSDDSSLLVATTAFFEPHAGADVEVLKLDGASLNAILDLQETPWDDYESILLNGKPVNEKSPGQRSSAMLPLIALAETTPLIIDQPEDNLDKRLVGSVLMNVLAELKERRQIIVCTHDPNILVGGDAEQVVVLEAETDRRASVKLHGSIDNEDIVKTVIDLLEGGQAAFDNRRRRYDL